MTKKNDESIIDKLNKGIKDRVARGELTCEYCQHALDKVNKYPQKDETYKYSCTYRDSVIWQCPCTKHNPEQALV